VATPVVVDDILEIKTFCKQGSQVGINVLHYRVSSIGGTSRTDDQIATAVEALFAPLYKAWMPSTALWLGLRVQIIKGAVLPTHQEASLLSGVGARAADGIAPQVSGMIQKKTGLAGRANRGRVYCPFLAEDCQTATGQVEAAGIANMTSFAVVAFNPITVNSAGNQAILDPVLWHRGSQTHTAINGYTVLSVFATQRRRSLVNRGDSDTP